MVKYIRGIFMKKLLILSLFLLLPLTSCGESSSPVPSIEPSDVSNSTNPNSNPAPSSQPKEDFTIKISDNGVSIGAESYVLTKENPNEKYYAPTDDFLFDINVPGMAWLILNQEDIKESVKIEDESILTPDAITFDFPGGVGNYVNRIYARINREKILKTGKTKVKINVIGTRDDSHQATLCFELDIKEYGGINVDTFDHTTVTLDKDSLKEKMKDYANADVTKIAFSISDSQEIYGYSADGSISNNIDPKTLDGTYSSTFKFAKGHVYELRLFVAQKDPSSPNPDALKIDWLHFNNDSTQLDKYKVADDENDSSSLEVFADNTNITLTLK